MIIKACEPGTSGRYVTVVGPNRVYPSPDNLYLSLCEVAVYGGCPPLPAAALSNTLSAAEAAAAESLGAHCQITMGTDSLSFADAERACNLQGGHLASIHSEEEAEYARALVSNSPWARQGEAWIGLVSAAATVDLSKKPQGKVPLHRTTGRSSAPATAAASSGPTARRTTS